MSGTDRLIYEFNNKTSNTKSDLDIYSLLSMFFSVVESSSNNRSDYVETTNVYNCPNNSK